MSESTDVGEDAGFDLINPQQCDRCGTFYDEDEDALTELCPACDRSEAWS